MAEFELMAKWNSCVISPSDTDTIPLLCAKGLRIFFLCRHGIGRSWAAAQEATVLGAPSVCLEGGLSLIKSLSHKKRVRIIKNIAVAPCVLAILTPEEERDFASILRSIGSLRQERVSVVEDIKPYLHYLGSKCT